MVFRSSAGGTWPSQPNCPLAPKRQPRYARPQGCDMVAAAPMLPSYNRFIKHSSAISHPTCNILAVPNAPVRQPPGVAVFPFCLAFCVTMQVLWP